jgi:succinyl-CoA synthetase beta subunit
MTRRISCNASSRHTPALLRADERSRHVKIHEYQAKQLLRGFGVAVPHGRLATSPAEAQEAARDLGGGPCVLKAQIHAGGRGKAGGVRLAPSPEQAQRQAASMLGAALRTPQTGPAGQIVRKLWVEDGCRIARELYLGMTLDFDTGRVTVMASPEGGVDIEEVARTRPERIHRISIDPLTGLLPFEARALGRAVGLAGDALSGFVRFARALHDAYAATDASLAEVNPLAVTDAGQVLALDAKMTFDDNALFRHADVAALHDPDEEDARESRAKEHELSYVALEGDIGCLVNGAGLAMATMDIIQRAGGRPANFLDVGGGADERKVAAAFELVLSDASVRAVLVNIFGGIMRCDVIATGIVVAARRTRLAVPLVVRLEGTNVEEGRAILARSGLEIIAAADLGDAARKAVAAAARQPSSPAALRRAS